MHVTKVLQLALVAFTSLRVAAAPFENAQQPLAHTTQPERSHVEVDKAEAYGQRKLRGKFLHVTDFHPDPFYKVYSSTAKEAACHGDRGPAGFYGAETSDCDSPVTLVNATFNWIKEHVVDDVDFVIWTGDSARHDNDENIPRSDAQVMAQNRLLVSKFNEVFGKPDNINDTDPTNDFIVPIVPTFGNNDILPHNIFLPGPNRWTANYLDIWRQFIPEEQRHGFQEGGWFYVEVIPGKLAVLSLNTLYFFDANSATDGCASKSEPGYEHMEWLRIQLQFIRERGMKAILMGHVPPAHTVVKQSWDETCWQKFTLNLRQYRDVVVGSFFGHMNIDHFMMQDFNDIDIALVTGEKRVSRSNAPDDVSISSAVDYLLSLRHVWKKLPSPPKGPQVSWADDLDGDDEDLEEEDGWMEWLGQQFVQRSKIDGKDKHKKKKKEKNKHGKFYKEIGGRWAERYAVSHVQSSIVPNYFPTLRIVEYNISGLEEGSVPSSRVPKDVETQNKGKHDRKKHKKPKKPKKPKFKVPDPPAKTAPPGPAYSPQTLSLLGYTQYFVNLTHINNDFPKDISSDSLGSSDENELPTGNRWREGKHHDKKPHLKNPKPHPKKFEFQKEYSTVEDKIYRLKDLSVLSYVDLARQIAKESGHKVGMVPAFEENDEEIGGADLYNNSSEISHSIHKNSASPERVSKSVRKEDTRGVATTKKKMNRVWFTFIKRAFIGTMDPDDIQEQFGGEI